jgi:hypothetical protein
MTVYHHMGQRFGVARSSVRADHRNNQKERTIVDPTIASRLRSAVSAGQWRAALRLACDLAESLGMTACGISSDGQTIDARTRSGDRCELVIDSTGAVWVQLLMPEVCQ